MSDKEQYALLRRAGGIETLRIGTVILIISLILTCLLGTFYAGAVEYVSAALFAIGIAGHKQCYRWNKFDEAGFTFSTIALYMGAVSLALYAPDIVGRVMGECCLLYGTYLCILTFMHCHAEPFEMRKGVVLLMLGAICLFKTFFF